MKMQPNNYCIILAGGKGRRLWPYSNKSRPKQFVDFFGCGRTQLQQTYDRFAKLLPAENVYVCTTAMYHPMVLEQLPEVPKDNIIIEPVNRNTAPSVAWANLYIKRRNPEARVIVTPSDQMIMNEDAFLRDIADGLDFVATHDTSLVMGVQPTRPEPSYGYIQKGDSSERDDVWKVQSFTEKPERQFAQMFVDSGEFLWNTGLFLFSTQRLYNLFIEVFTDDSKTIDKVYPKYTLDEAIDFTEHSYSSAPNVSIDYAVLEKSDKVNVMRGDFGWADIGSWHSIYENMSKSADDNVVIDSEVILDDCRSNIIKLPKGKLAVINGLDGYIITERDNVLLICKKDDSSSLVRKFINEVRMKYGDKFV